MSDQEYNFKKSEIKEIVLTIVEEEFGKCKESLEQSITESILEKISEGEQEEKAVPKTKAKKAPAKAAPKRTPKAPAKAKASRKVVPKKDVNFNTMTIGALKKYASDNNVPLPEEGSGKSGNLIKQDYIDAAMKAVGKS